MTAFIQRAKKRWLFQCFAGSYEACEGGAAAFAKSVSILSLHSFFRFSFLCLFVSSIHLFPHASFPFSLVSRLIWGEPWASCESGRREAANQLFVHFVAYTIIPCARTQPRESRGPVRGRNLLEDNLRQRSCSVQMLHVMATVYEETRMNGKEISETGARTSRTHTAAAPVPWTDNFICERKWKETWIDHRVTCRTAVSAILIGLRAVNRTQVQLYWPVPF
jgi:hypothetical protein